MLNSYDLRLTCINYSSRFWTSVSDFFVAPLLTQFGFRPGTGVEHALLIFESVTEQSLEKGIWQTYYLFFSFVCSTPPTRVSWRIHSAADFALWFAMLLCGRKQHLCTINRESNRVMFLALPYSTLAWEMPWVHGNNALDVMVPA